VEERSGTARISEETAALVLDRAAKLDAGRGRWLAVSELREAALEAGISADSFERALEEVEELAAERRAVTVHPSEATSPEQADPEGWPVWARRMTLLGSGFFLGGLAIFLSQVVGFDGAGVAFALLIALQVAVASLVKHRKEGDVIPYWIELGFLWVGLTFMLMLTGPADRVLAVMGGLGGLIGLIGASVIALANRDAPRSLPESS
jgi:hypothetical protein